jgi:hypothetical protein
MSVLLQNYKTYVGEKMEQHDPRDLKNPCSGKIRTTLEVVQHLPLLYRDVAEYLVARGEIEIVAEIPQPTAAGVL